MTVSSVVNPAPAQLAVEGYVSVHPRLASEGYVSTQPRLASGRLCLSAAQTGQ